MLTTFSSLVAPDFVFMTTYSATSDDKVGIITIYGSMFQLKKYRLPNVSHLALNTLLILSINDDNVYLMFCEILSNWLQV